MVVVIYRPELVLGGRWRLVEVVVVIYRPELVLGGWWRWWW